MKETDFNEAQESKEENIDVKELLFKYLIHWPWFVGTVVVCLIAAWVYLYMSTPVYNISATVLIKDDKKGGSAGMLSGLESLGLDGMVSSSQNIDNEIEVLRSKTIVKEVVEDLEMANLPQFMGGYVTSFKRNRMTGLLHGCWTSLRRKMTA